MTKDEALKLALEWAEARGEIVFAGGGMDAVNKMNSWVTAIKKALAQPEQETPKGWKSEIWKSVKQQEQEPVAWVWVNNKGWLNYGETPHDMFKSSPLYPHPQRTWVGLTDEEIDLVCVGLWSGGWRKKAMQDFAKAIEAKLKEKNT